MIELTALELTELILYFPIVILICVGIWHEDKLVRFERKLWRVIKAIVKTIKDEIRERRAVKV